MVEDEPMKLHCGTALAYIRRGLAVVQQYTNMKAKKMRLLFNNQDIGQLKPLLNRMQARFFEVKKKNDFVYKEVERNPKELPEIKGVKSEIKPKVPPTLFDPVSESGCFENFVSGEMEILLQQFQNVVREQKQKLSDTLTNMIQHKK